MGNSWLCFSHSTLLIAVAEVAHQTSCKTKTSGEKSFTRGFSAGVSAAET